MVELAAMGRSGSLFGQGSSSFIAAYSSFAILVPLPFRVYTPLARRKSRSLVATSIPIFWKSSAVNCSKLIAYSSERSAPCLLSSLYIVILQSTNWSSSCVDASAGVLFPILQSISNWFGCVIACGCGVALLEDISDIVGIVCCREHVTVQSVRVASIKTSRRKIYKLLAISSSQVASIKTS